MTIRRRTLRRLGAFLLVLTLVMAAGLWMYGRGARRQAQHLLEQREQGLALLAIGDFEGALRPLENYLAEGDPQRIERDFEARLAYAQARLSVPESGDRHIEQSARLLRDLADDFAADPRRRAALHLLMLATREGGDWNELRRLSDETLDAFAMDLQALRMRRLAAEQLGDLASALADSQQLNELVPQDVDEHIWSLGLLARLGWSAEAIVRHAVDLGARYPQDSRFLLVLAVAYQNAGQAQQAVACLRQAAQSELPEQERAAYVKRLAGLFDAFGEHALARDVYARALERTAPEHPESAVLQQLLALRLWQAGDLEAALAVIPPLSREQRRSSIELAATRILLQFEHGETAEAQLHLDMLGRSLEEELSPRHRRLALAWHAALSAAYAGAQGPVARPSVRARLESIQQALTRVRDQLLPASAPPTDEPAALFLKWAGDLYAELGEIELAVRHWRAAALHLPGWDDPHLLTAQGTLQKGLLEESEQAARAAASRSPEGDEQPAQVLLAQIAYRQWLEAPSTGGAEEAAALALAHQQANPLHPGTLPIHVHMTALADPEAARLLVRDRLQMGAEPELRIELAKVSDRVGLGMEDALLAEVAHPEGALLRALELAQRGEIDRGLNALEPPAGAPQPSVQWDIARARYLQEVRPADAAADWQRVCGAHPDDVLVQLAMFNEADLALLDRQFLAEAIQRLATLTGPTGRRWRIEKARWLLAEQSPTAALDSAELLRGLIRESAGADTVDARLLLADALMIGGNLRVAVEHLEAAYALAPARGDVGLRLIGLLERSGRREEARRLLGRLAAEGVRGDRERLEVASRLARSGELETAISLLRQAQSAGHLEPEGQSVLAELLQRAGNAVEARRVYEQMLASRAPGPAALLSAAVFHRLEGEEVRAAQVLARLEEAPLAAAEKHLVRGSYHARVGEIEAAERSFASALVLAPTYAAPWREAMAFEISRDEPARALAIAQRAAQVGVADERLKALACQAAAFQAISGEDDVAAQLSALSAAVAVDGSVPAWAPVPAVLAAASQAMRQHRELSVLELAQLEEVAEIFELFTPLQVWLIETYTRRGNAAEAARLARRLADWAPYHPDAQRLAFAACRDASSYTEAEHFALRWRMRVTPDSMHADAAVAEARLLAGEYARALDALQPHLAGADEASPELLPLLTIAAEAHAALGDYAAAAALIEPRLHGSADWRAVALRLASERIRDADEALRWLEAVEQAIREVHEIAGPDTAALESGLQERLRLATAWMEIGNRFARPDALDRGRLQLIELTTGPLRQAPEAWEALAQAWLFSAAPAEAQTAFRRVLILDPRRAAPANQLARLLLSEDDAQARVEALTWARVAAEQDPSNADYQDTLGRAYLLGRDRARAREAFERALRLEDTHPGATLGLARLLAGAGETDAARRWLARVEKAEALSPALQDELADLTRELNLQLP